LEFLSSCFFELDQPHDFFLGVLDKQTLVYSMMFFHCTMAAIAGKVIFLLLEVAAVGVAQFNVIHAQQ
jgi:hypothetical protein